MNISKDSVVSQKTNDLKVKEMNDEIGFHGIIVIYAINIFDFIKI